MSRVRVLVGTRKGAFVLTADGTRTQWDVSGPHFGGWEIYHLKGSPADPNRLYASQSSSWFGQVIQRSNDGGTTWEAAGNKFVYDGPTGTHLWYDGTPHPWDFARVWHLEPSPADPDTVYAGVEDAALFRTTDGGQTWLRAARAPHPRVGDACGSRAPVGCACTRSCWTRAGPSACSSPSPPRVCSGATTRARPGGRSTVASSRSRFPTRRPRSATACTASRCIARVRTCCSCRSTGTSCAATTPARRGAR